MGDAARDEDELTPEERAQIRALLRLLQKAAVVEVDEQPDPKVRRTATDEDFAEIQRIRRRKGLSRG